MPKFIIIAERYVEEAWTLHVEAETEEEALKMKALFEVNSDSGHKYIVKKH